MKSPSDLFFYSVVIVKYWQVLIILQIKMGCDVEPMILWCFLRRLVDD